VWPFYTTSQGQGFCRTSLLKRMHGPTGGNLEFPRSFFHQDFLILYVKVGRSPPTHFFFFFLGVSFAALKEKPPFPPICLIVFPCRYQRSRDFLFYLICFSADVCLFPLGLPNHPRFFVPVFWVAGGGTTPLVLQSPPPPLHPLAPRFGKEQVGLARLALHCPIGDAFPMFVFLFFAFFGSPGLFRR